MNGLEAYTKRWADTVKQKHAAETEVIVDQIYNTARDLAASSPGLKNAESGLSERTGKFFRSISKRTIYEPDGSVAFEIYYDKNICSYADYIENGTKRIKPFKIIARAYDDVLSGGNAG